MQTRPTRAVNCVTVFVQRLDELNATLIIGRRTNVYGNDKLRHYIPDDVTRLAKIGRLFKPHAEDYFFMSAQGYPWHRVPRDIVIGRIGYDNFLVANAIRYNVSVVDVTNTMNAVHQSTVREGDFAGHRQLFSGKLLTYLLINVFYLSNIKPAHRPHVSSYLAARYLQCESKKSPPPCGF